MSNRDDFVNLMRHESPEEYRERRQKEFEDARVRYALRCLDVADFARHFERKSMTLHNHRYLTFDLFNEEFGGFPVYLGAAFIPKVHEDPKGHFLNLLTGFSQSPYWVAYNERRAMEREACGRKAFGLVFHRRGIRDGVILYDGEPFGRKGGRFTYTGGGERKPLVCHLEPFNTVLQAIHASGWSPK